MKKLEISFVSSQLMNHFQSTSSSHTNHQMTSDKDNKVQLQPCSKLALSQ